ncbi:MAG TPA: DUF3156 family protein [Thermoleophilaceae bacterium]
MRGLSKRRAATTLRTDVEAFERLGYRSENGPSDFAVILRGGQGARDLRLELTGEGAVFGGNWGLEVSTAEPVLPATSGGLKARGRGVVRMQGVRFRARGGDEAAAQLAEALSSDASLAEAVARVHFERLFIAPDGRPVIRHIGGSVVWVLFPPIVRATPLPEGQPEEIVRALEAFAAAGGRARG